MAWSPRIVGVVVMVGCGRPSGDSTTAGTTTGAGVPPTTWAVEEPYPPGAPPVAWFQEVTDETGIRLSHQLFAQELGRLSGAGMAAGDVDEDGRVDLVLAPGAAAPRLYLGQGALAYEDVTSVAGLGDDPASSVAMEDINGDGHLDLVFGRDDMVGFDGATATLRLMLGDGTGGFRDATLEAGIESHGHLKAVAIRDLDLDGLLDIYACNYASSPRDLELRQDQIFRARGDGSFEEIGDRLEADEMGLTWVMAAFDPAGDGSLVLFAGNDDFVADDGTRPLPPAPEEYQVAPDRLLTTLGIGEDGYPEMVPSADPVLLEPRSTMGAVSADFDGDGRLDLFLSDLGRNELLLSQADGSWLDGTEAFGLEAPWRDDSRCPPGGFDLRCLLVAWGAVFEDLDLDGYRDLLLVHGQVSVDDGRQPVAVWRGRGESDLEPVQSDLPWMDARSVVSHDLDRDGDLDLVVSTWAGPFRIFENMARSSGEGPEFAAATFVGTSSAPGGSGVRVSVSFDGHQRVLELGTGGLPYSQRSSELLVGTGGAAVLPATVTWPTGLQQDVVLEANRSTAIVEPSVFELSSRVERADGQSSVDVTVTPRARDGQLSGSGVAVAIESSLGSWSGPTLDVGDGSYVRTLVAPTEPGLAVLRIAIDGDELWIRPRVSWQ